MTNPYAPPESGDQPYREAPPETVMPVHGPPTAIPKVFGILSIVFGSLVLIFGLMTGCMGMAFDSIKNFGANMPQGAGKAAEQAQLMMEHLGTIYFYMGIQGFVFALMSAVLLTVGIGQLRYKRWARDWTIYWCIAGFVVLVGALVLSFTVVGPAYQEMFDAIAKAGPSGAMPAAMGSKISGMVGGTSGIMMLVFYAPYPILQLIYFMRPRVIAAMQG